MKSAFVHTSLNYVPKILAQFMGGSESVGLLWAENLPHFAALIAANWPVRQLQNVGEPPDLILSTPRSYFIFLHTVKANSLSQWHWFCC